jgi:hypothetical protein
MSPTYWLPSSAVAPWQQVRADDRPAIDSLCQLQQTAAQASHVSVRVAGSFSDGVDMGVLTASNCPTGYTWVELALKSIQNRNKLVQTLQHSGHAQVVFSGEFYGPPVPDSHLPDSIRKNYHPGWGHLAGFQTKLVVYKIESVE